MMMIRHARTTTPVQQRFIPPTTDTYRLTEPPHTANGDDKSRSTGTAGALPTDRLVTRRPLPQGGPSFNLALASPLLLPACPLICCACDPFCHYVPHAVVTPPAGLTLVTPDNVTPIRRRRLKPATPRREPHDSSNIKIPILFYRIRGRAPLALWSIWVRRGGHACAGLTQQEPLSCSPQAYTLSDCEIVDMLLKGMFKLKS